MVYSHMVKHGMRRTPATFHASHHVHRPTYYRLIALHTSPRVQSTICNAPRTSPHASPCVQHTIRTSPHVQRPVRNIPCVQHRRISSCARNALRTTPTMQSGLPQVFITCSSPLRLGLNPRYRNAPHPGGHPPGPGHRPGFGAVAEKISCGPRWICHRGPV